MSETCHCPLCRFARGELTKREIGFYLLGCTHTYAHFTEEELDIGRRDYDRDCCHMYLKDVVKELKESNSEVDPAFLDPTNYTLRSSHEGSEGIRNR